MRLRRQPMAEDAIDRARTAVKERADLPGMSLMEHLEELRSRHSLVRRLPRLSASSVSLTAFRVAPHPRSSRSRCSILACKMTMTHPTDALNLVIKTSARFRRYPRQLPSSSTRSGSSSRPACTPTRKNTYSPLWPAPSAFFSQWRLVRLPLRAARRHGRSSSRGLRKKLQPHDHHRGLYGLLPRRDPRAGHHV